ncbi:MAG: DNA methyltransferase [Candidatus Nanoarchaeia archaeon]|nr:DNA methyltransferase [Candidatus Nanoarchaeia archaeon]
MHYLFLISGENPELAKAEIELFAGADIKGHSGSSVVAECGKFEKQRLACTKYLCKFLFSCETNELNAKVQSFGWQKHYRDNFYVHVHHTEQAKEKELAEIIWKKLKNPKVEFKNPKTEIDFVFENKKVFCGIRLDKNKEKFEARKAHKRPAFSPISLHPKLARALINMTGVKKGGTILDPFCGTAGILIEAGLMGIRCIGSDIAEEMLDKAKINLNAYGVKGCKLIKADARKIKIKCSAIATDPPYGKASSLHKQSIKKLYSEFLSNAYRILDKKSRLAVIFPNRLSVKSKFKVLRRIDIPIHKSLTRTINVLEKN